MAFNRFTDAEIYAELHKLGFIDVSEAMFQKVRDELNKYIAYQETSSSPDSSRTSSSSERSSNFNFRNSSSTLRNKSPLRRSSSESSIRSNFRSRATRLSIPNKENSMCSETSTRPRFVKRKVLRHVDGERIIEEGVRIVPPVVSRPSWNDDVKLSSSLFSSSYDDLSLDMQSLSLGKNSKLSSSKSSIILPNYNVTRRKHDPVARYHQYRKYWDTFKPPGENKHSSLRWTVREKMLDYDFA